MNKKGTVFTKRSGLTKLFAGMMVCAIPLLTPRPAAAQKAAPPAPSPRSARPSMAGFAGGEGRGVRGGVSPMPYPFAGPVAQEAYDDNHLTDQLWAVLTLPFRATAVGVEIAADFAGVALDLAGDVLSFPHNVCVEIGFDEDLCDVADLLLVAVPVGSAMKMAVATRSGRVLRVPKGAAQARAQKYYDAKVVSGSPSVSRVPVTGGARVKRSATARVGSSSKRHVTGNPSTTRPKSKKAKKATTRPKSKKAKKATTRPKSKKAKKATTQPKSKKAKRVEKKAKKKAKKVEKKVEKKAKKKADKAMAAEGRRNFKSHNKELDAAEKRLAKGKKCDKNCKRQRSEIAGERAAAKTMSKRRGPRCDMLRGYNKGRGFDQVWQCGSQTVLVEAKGGNSKLGSILKGERRIKQNSKEWVEIKVRELQKSGIKADKELGERIGRALKVKGGLKVETHKVKVNGVGKDEVGRLTWTK